MFGQNFIFQPREFHCDDFFAGAEIQYTFRNLLRNNLYNSSQSTSKSKQTFVCDPETTSAKKSILQTFEYIVNSFVRFCHFLQIDL